MKLNLDGIIRRFIYASVSINIICSINVFPQTNTRENYFPINLGTTWVYEFYPEFSGGAKERIIITKDSVSITDNSHFVFMNNGPQPYYRVDTLGNVFRFPSGLSSNSNWLIFKQYAQAHESWLMTDTTKDTSQIRAFARVKETGVFNLFNRPLKYKSVEWGMGCSTCGSDSFNNSPRLDYFAENIGWFFAIVEPSATERWLIGIISQGDTLGKVTTVINLLEQRISSFILHQNYPNPFNSSTVIHYELKSDQWITIKIFDLLGREVQQLLNQRQSAGIYKINFESGDLKTGMYLLQLKAGGNVQLKKLLLLK
jgi:hypothetical protein